MADSLQPATGATSSTGLEPNVAGALAYLFAPISGIVLYVMEKENASVRFHAAQSIVFGAGLIVAWIAFSVLSAVLGVIPVLGWLMIMALWLALLVGGFFAWGFLMFKAFNGQEYELPVAGAQARKLLAGQPQA